MGRLNSGPSGGTQAIGEAGLRRFIDELNDRRAQLGVPERYGIERVDGKWTMAAARRPRPAELVQVVDHRVKMPSAFG